MRRFASRAESWITVMAVGLLLAFGLLGGCSGSDSPSITNPYWGNYNSGNFDIGNGNTGSFALAVQPSSDQILGTLIVFNAAGSRQIDFNGTVNRSTGTYQLSGGPIVFPGQTLSYTVSATGQLIQGGGGTYDIAFSNPNTDVIRRTGNLTRGTTNTNTTTTGPSTTGITTSPTTTTAGPTTTTGPGTTTSPDPGCTGASITGSVSSAVASNVSPGSFAFSKGNGQIGATSQGDAAIAGAAITCPVNTNGLNRALLYGVTNRTTIANGQSFPIGLAANNDSNSYVTYLEQTVNNQGTVTSQRTWRGRAGAGTIIINSFSGNTQTFTLQNVTMEAAGGGATGTFTLNASGTITQNVPPTQ